MFIKTASTYCVNALYHSKLYFQKLRQSKFRQVVWPIKSTELTQFILMAFLMFVILLNQNIIRAVRNSIVTTEIGAESISFIRLWGEMPIGFLFIVFYAKLCNTVSAENAFRIVVVLFLLLFLSFNFIILPYQHLFHPTTDTVELLSLQFPNFKWFIKIWGKWSFVLFYIMGELWPTIVFSLLYWQLANKITSTAVASRFYSFLNLFGQTNLLISGTIIAYFCQSSIYNNLNSISFAQKQSMLTSLMIIVIVSTIVILVIHRWIEKRFISSKLENINSDNKNTVLKMSLRDSIRVILSSRYLGLICVMLISYSIVINLIEGVWLFKVQKLYSTTDQFIRYQGSVLASTGICALICSFIGSSVIRYLGWYWGAVITPVTILVVGGCFFLCITFEEYLGFFASSSSLLYIVVSLGTLQNVLSKGVKYSLFDATKEMAYIPLDNEMKTKGKAAVEIAGSSVGKAISSMIQFVIFTLSPSAQYDDITIFLATPFVIICVLWILSIKMLNRDYVKILSVNNNNHIS